MLGGPARSRDTCVECVCAARTGLLTLPATEVDLSTLGLFKFFLLITCEAVLLVIVCVRARARVCVCVCV